jgi:acetyl esterase
MLSSRHIALENETRALLDWVAQHQPDRDASISALREWTRRFEYRFRLPDVDVASVCDESVAVDGDAIGLRMYRPLSEVRSDGELPGILFIHGGGWIQCGIDTHDELCRHLCNTTGAAVLSVDYRLAPENRFPGQVGECRMVYEYICAHSGRFRVDPSRMFVCGDSSGGNLATVLCHDLIGADFPQFKAQLLIYPSVALCRHTQYRSWKAFGGGQYLLSDVTLSRTKKYYLSTSEDINNPRVSPILFQDLGGMPPALIIAAECDPIRDGAREYAGRLIDAGISVQYLEFPKTVHGFISLGTPRDTALRAISNIGTYVHSILNNL